MEQMKAKITQLEQTLTQYEVEYNVKADEVDKMQEKLQTKDDLVG